MGSDGGGGLTFPRAAVTVGWIIGLLALLTDNTRGLLAGILLVLIAIYWRLDP